MLAYHQGIIFKKYKENNKFMSVVTEFKISKTTISFKKGIIKFIDDCPKMRKSCISLHYLKTRMSAKNMPPNFDNIFLKF